MEFSFTHILSHINTIYVLRTTKALLASEFVTPELILSEHSRMRLKVINLLTWDTLFTH